MPASAILNPAPRPVFDLDLVPDKDRERVAQLIPAPAVALSYVHRTIDGIYDFDYLDAAIEDRENVLLTGPTGSSKSTLWRAYCASRRLPLAIVESNASMDLSTVLGTLDPQEMRWVDGKLTLVARYGGVGVLEEINMAPPRITAGFHQLPSVARRLELPENNGETVVAGRGHQTPVWKKTTDEDGNEVEAWVYEGSPQPLLFAGNMNPSPVYQGTVRMNYALLNRFAQPHEWDYLREVEEQLVDSAHLLDIAHSLRNLPEIRTPVSTNMLMTFERHVWRFGWDPAVTMFTNHFDEGERNSVARALHAERDNVLAEQTR